AGLLDHAVRQRQERVRHRRRYRGRGGVRLARRSRAGAGPGRFNRVVLRAEHDVGGDERRDAGEPFTAFGEGHVRLLAAYEHYEADIRIYLRIADGLALDVQLGERRRGYRRQGLVDEVAQVRIARLDREFHIVARQAPGLGRTVDVVTGVERDVAG